MEIILIILTSTLIGAFLVAMLLIGFKLGVSYERDNKQLPSMDETNKDYVKGVAAFFDYKGE